MISFTLALALLIVGYVVYGGFMTRIVGIDEKRPTPAILNEDGVDFVPLPTWRIFLIQFLNIAGLGPIFGAIMGVVYGPAAFFWIVFGTIFAGATHDFLAAMMSLRMGGMSWPQMIGSQLGKKVQHTVIFLSALMLLVVVAVMAYNPADLMANLTPKYLNSTFWVIVIFAYYIAATMFPIDKLIGKIYPIFGGALLFMAAGILIMIYVHGADMPEIWSEFYNHSADPEKTPIFPMMFVSIACGAISGFHATQSPLMARCIRTERHGRLVFYGAMVAEGIVALIWAAAAITFCKGYSGVAQYISGSTPSVLVNEISMTWMGSIGGILAILGVVAAPITSGDTAMRSVRLIVADALHLSQKKLISRILVTLPLVVIVFVIMILPYDAVWRYFAWFNQTLSVFTLWALSLWLERLDKPYVITMLPAMFMTAVCTTYIFFAPEGLNLLTGALGFTIPYSVAVGIGIGLAVVFMLMFLRHIRANRRLLAE
ncbi:MAG: carbon starvation protein A [Muribaculaceae bacterium]|nr:carbon starvation protein A [Muribaculaceae bacterium]